MVKRYKSLEKSQKSIFFFFKKIVLKKNKINLKNAIFIVLPNEEIPGRVA